MLFTIFMVIVGLALLPVAIYVGFQIIRLIGNIGYAVAVVTCKMAKDFYEVLVDLFEFLTVLPQKTVELAREIPSSCASLYDNIRRLFVRR